MDDRAHLAEALLGRLAALAQDAQYGVLDDAAESGELDVALPAAALEGVPRALAAFCREFDLKLVQLIDIEAGGWRAVLAWGDELGRPRFLDVEAHADWYRGGVLLLRAQELLDPGPAVRFAHGLLRLLFRRAEPCEAELRRLDVLRDAAPRAALDVASRYFPGAPDLRLVSQAARLQDWSQVLAHRARLRRAARRASPHRWRGMAPVLGRLVRSALRPARAVIAFVGTEDARREAVHQAVLRDLAPAFPSGAATIAYRPGDEHWGIDLRIVLGDLPAGGHRDAVHLGIAQPLTGVVADAHAAILGWLESRVERRFPETLVGANPPAARLLQWASRSRLPVLRNAVQTLLNCDLDCELRAPVLMPHPYGIVIERGTQIGNRVTVYQQATLAASADGAPVVEENACIGPGARIIGAVRIGRHAVVGANAVVTRDVPSHCTVVGANRILNVARPPAGAAQAGLSPGHDVRQRKSVVNS